MKRFKPVNLSQVAQTRRDVLSISFSELLELYCQSRPAKRPEIREYRLRKWRAQFRHLPEWKVTAAHVNAMVTAMEAQGYAARTINRDVADIASCYAWAIKRRYCPVDFQSPTREFQRGPDAPCLVAFEVIIASLKKDLWLVRSTTICLDTIFPISPTINCLCARPLCSDYARSQLRIFISVLKKCTKVVLFHLMAQLSASIVCAQFCMSKGSPALDTLDCQKRC